MVGANNKKDPELDNKGYLVEMRDLKLSYRKTYWGLRQALKDAEANLRDQGGNLIEHPDIKVLKGAISDVNFAITWMHTGRIPGSKRGIERRSVYQNTKLLDPMIMANFANPSNSRSGSSLTEDEKTALREVLELLSPQEKECYVMAHGHGIPHEQIAGMLGITKASVSTYIKRAHEKVSRGWQGTLW